MNTVRRTVLAVLALPVWSAAQANPPLTPVVLADIEPGAGSGFPSGLTLFRDRVWFAAQTAQNGRELWVTDGTTAGTRLFHDLFPGTRGGAPSDFCVLGGRMFFAATSASGAGRELWVTDGTVAGTVMFADLNPGSGASSPRLLTRIGDRIYFSADDGVTGQEPWVSDGTVPGTFRLADIKPGAAGSEPGSFAGFPGQVVFGATDGGTVGREPWITDGTVVGTRLLDDVNQGPGSSDPAYMLALDGHVYFAADDGNVGSELWWTDFTAAGTTLFADLYRGSTGSSPAELVPAWEEDRGFLFVATTGQASLGRTIFTCDGTQPGIRLAHPGGVNIPSPIGNINPAGIRVAGGRKVYFGGTQGAYVGELFVLDVTRDPFTAVRAYDLNPVTVSNPGDFVLLGSRVLFRAMDAAHGSELWSIPNGATRRPVDIGCSGSRLRVEDPRIGFDVLYMLETDVPNAAALFMLGLPLPSPVVLPQLSACPIHVDPSAATLVAFPAGWHAGTFPVPPIVQLDDMTFVLQFFLASTTVPTAFDFTNAVYLHLGF